MELVNVDPLRTKEMVLQAGAFGEHRFRTVREVGTTGAGGNPSPTDSPTDGGGNSRRVVKVDSHRLPIELRPGGHLRLKIEMDRHVLSPSYEQPF